MRGLFLCDLRAMFFVISKFLHFIIKPHFWIFLFVLITLLKLWFSNKKWIQKLPITAKRSAFIAFLLLFILGNHPLVNELNIRWEQRVPQKRIYHQDSFPRIAVILGGYGYYDDQNDYFRLGSEGDRFMVGLQGLLLNKFDKVILTGGSSAIFNKVYYEAEEAGRYLQNMGIDSSKIIIDNLSRNTYENALYTQKILDSLNYKQPVLLVTSAAHMYRSEGCYKKVGVNFIPYVAHPTCDPNRRYNLEAWLIPNPGSLQTMSNLLHEWVGVISYKLSGKM